MARVAASKRVRRFIDAPQGQRCTAVVTLRDGSQADCGRRAVHTDRMLCTQHHKKANASAAEDAADAKRYRTMRALALGDDFDAWTRLYFALDAAMVEENADARFDAMVDAVSR